MKKKNQKRIIFIVFFILLLMIVDFGLKYFFDGPFQEIVFSCSYPSDCRYGYFPLIGDIFGVRLSYNPGIAFSLPIQGIYLQILTICIIVLLLGYYIFYEFPKKNKWIDIAFICIFAGALSHLYERVFIGHVIDFLALKHFAIFNFADVLITIGAIILLLYTFFYEQRK